MISVNHWDGGERHHPPGCAGLSMPQDIPLDVILFTQFGQSFFRRLLMGKLGKRSDHLLITYFSLYFLFFLFFFFFNFWLPSSIWSSWAGIRSKPRWWSKPLLQQCWILIVPDWGSNPHPSTPKMLQTPLHPQEELPFVFLWSREKAKN